eukprot:7831832-Lingulodinium_polyedra.AAC.1
MNYSWRRATHAHATSCTAVSSQTAAKRATQAKSCRRLAFCVGFALPQRRFRGTTRPADAGM